MKEDEHFSADSEADIVVEDFDNPLITYGEHNTVMLTSPTFGDTIKIRNPQVKFGSSKNALRELKHIEEQMKGMSVLPDFGYSEDNYILSHHESQNKWRMLTGLLGDTQKFEWLMTYIKL